MRVSSFLSAVAYLLSRESGDSGFRHSFCIEAGPFVHTDTPEIFDEVASQLNPEDQDLMYTMRSVGTPSEVFELQLGGEVHGGYLVAFYEPNGELTHVFTGRR